MRQNTEKTYRFPIPLGYNKRYTLDLLIKRKAINDAISIAKVQEDLLQELENGGVDTSLKQRMLYSYRMQEKEEDGPILSEERQKIIANFFGISIEELHTD